MQRHAFLVLSLLMLLTALFLMIQFPEKAQSVETHFYPEDFPGQTLQQAIWNDTVEEGERVFVNSGVWIGNLAINKSIIFEGRNRYDTIIEGEIRINVTNVEILQFTIRNAGAGISVKSTSNCRISLNRITNNTVGVELRFSSYCVLENNEIYSNAYNLRVIGDTLEHYIHDINALNTVDGQPVYYCVNKTNEKAPQNAGFIAIVNSTDIIVENLTSLQSNYAGILVGYSSRITLRNIQFPGSYRNFENAIEFENVENSVIQNVTLPRAAIAALNLEEATNNSIIDNVITFDYTGWGIVLSNSSGNQVVANNVSRAYVAVALENSNGNIFSRNNFADYGNRLAVSGSSYNQFDNGYEGNYWSDYRDKYPNATEVDGTGIWDTPYASTNNPDNYPLISNWTANRVFKRPMTNEPYPTSTQTLSTYSNSTLGNPPLGFSFNRTTVQISLKATTGYPAFLNVTIPRNWLDAPFNVTLNGEPQQFSMEANATHSWISLTYPEGRHSIQVKGTEVGSIQGDLNNDGKVNILDAIIIANNFGSRE